MAEDPSLGCSPRVPERLCVNREALHTIFPSETIQEADTGKRIPPCLLYSSRSRDIYHSGLQINLPLANGRVLLRLLHTVVSGAARQI